MPQAVVPGLGGIGAQRPATAAHNTRLRSDRAAVTLEDSQKTRPSRKSTRKSANRQKSGEKLGRRMAPLDP
jgi:hypothetical protein